MGYLFLGVLMMLSCTSNSLEINDIPRPTHELKVVKTETRLAAKSREATVKVVAVVGENITVATGTVVRYKGHNLVITAAHALGTPPFSAGVEINGEYILTKVVYFSDRDDLAMLLLPETVYARPIRFRPKKKGNLKIGEELIYSGYPNNDSLLTIKGYVASIMSSGDFYIHSYGWSGASGSCLFDVEGRLVGVLVAVGIGEDITGAPTVIEDMVYVTPIWKLDLNILGFNLKVLDK